MLCLYLGFDFNWGHLKKNQKKSVMWLHIQECVSVSAGWVIWYSAARWCTAAATSHTKHSSPSHSCASPSVSRSIWTSAPEFLWCPEAGRSPALRARRPTQPATTARPASPCCSTTKSFWRGQSPSEFKGCEGPTMCACLIKCLRSSTPLPSPHHHHPPPWF